MIMDIELRRLEKSLFPSTQRRVAPHEKDDHPGIKDDCLLSDHFRNENKQQPQSHRVTRSFLKHKSPNFISVHQPSDSLDQTNNIPYRELPTDCVLFYIPGRSIKSDILDSPELSRPNRYSFDLAANLLLVKMVTMIHSDIGQFVNQELILGITSMGLLNDIRYYSGATVRGEGRGKEGDQGWGPPPPNPAVDGKPTVTLEVGVSESQAKLQRDVEWWLHPDKGNANITITIKVDRKRPRLMIDRWEHIHGVIQSTQQVEISKVNGQVELTHDRLTIPFESLFRRQPAANEHNITLDGQTLQRLAERTWAAQGF